MTQVLGFATPISEFWSTWYSEYSLLSITTRGSKFGGIVLSWGGVSFTVVVCVLVCVCTCEEEWRDNVFSVHGTQTNKMCILCALPWYSLHYSCPQLKNGGSRYDSMASLWCTPEYSVLWTTTTFSRYDSIAYIPAPFSKNWRTVAFVHSIVPPVPGYVVDAYLDSVHVFAKRPR
jgi:hypothetical protein